MTNLSLERGINFIIACVLSISLLIVVVTVRNNTHISNSVTATCVDGTESKSRHASGTCSFHKGVEVWRNRWVILIK